MKKYKKHFLKEYKKYLFLKYVFLKESYLQYWNELQIQTIKELAKKLGYENPNDFAVSSNGPKFMKFFREFMINLLGHDKKNKNIPDVEKLKEIVSDEQKKKDVIYLVVDTSLKELDLEG
ncbi:MAG: hypothetical protein NZZ41_07865 [Candidatus Dojkabacteria bacterium]|nr:hypothetical protein [Candidatus Dojkabacteria bacterium]